MVYDCHTTYKISTENIIYVHKYVEEQWNLFTDKETILSYLVTKFANFKYFCLFWKIDF